MGQISKRVQLKRKKEKRNAEEPESQIYGARRTKSNQSESTRKTRISRASEEQIYRLDSDSGTNSRARRPNSWRVVYRAPHFAEDLISAAEEGDVMWAEEGRERGEEKKRKREGEGRESSAWVLLWVRSGEWNTMKRREGGRERGSSFPLTFLVVVEETVKQRQQLPDIYVSFFIPYFF